MRSRHIALLVTVGTATLVGCGETRYVVVQTPAPGVAAAATPASPTTAAAVPATTTATGGTDAGDTDDTGVRATDGAREGEGSATDPTALDVETTTDSTDAPATAAPAVAGPASIDDEAGIKAAIEGALGFDRRGYAERSDFIDGGSDLEPTMNAVLAVISGLDGGYEYQSITTNGDTAEAIVDVIVSGAPFSTGLPVELIKIGGEWKLTRAGACTIFSLASPCPDA